jgi:hypothetical protein
LRKIEKLVKVGGTVAGIKPAVTPSLSDDQNEFNKLVNEIWSSSNARVSSDKPLTEVLNAMKIVPDFTYDKSQNDTKLLFVHRTLTDREVYWVNNRNSRKETMNANFRVSGKVPVLWHPETAKTEPVLYSIANGITTVALSLEPNDAVFVIFKDKAVKTSVTLPPVEEKQLLTIEGSWKVNFQKDRGVPAESTFDKLISYTDSPDQGIKYFSGTATYTKTIVADKNWFADHAQLWLDLGDVKNLAEVIVNGTSLGVVWKQPFRVDVRDVLKAGDNKLEIKVTNLWVNRLIGDAQPGVANKITYTTMPFYQANSKLLPSGLLGPVSILALGK